VDIHDQIERYCEQDY